MAVVPQQLSVAGLCVCRTCTMKEIDTAMTEWGPAGRFWCSHACAPYNAHTRLWGVIPGGVPVWPRCLALGCGWQWSSVHRSCPGATPVRPLANHICISTLDLRCAWHAMCGVHARRYSRGTLMDVVRWHWGRGWLRTWTQCLQAGQLLLGNPRCHKMDWSWKALKTCCLRLRLISPRVPWQIVVP